MADDACSFFVLFGLLFEEAVGLIAHFWLTCSGKGDSGQTVGGGVGHITGVSSFTVSDLGIGKGSCGGDTTVSCLDL
jgi:hypothetical protein